MCVRQFSLCAPKSKRRNVWRLAESDSETDSQSDAQSPACNLNLPEHGRKKKLFVISECRSVNTHSGRLIAMAKANLAISLIILI